MLNNESLLAIALSEIKARSKNRHVHYYFFVQAFIIKYLTYFYLGSSSFSSMADKIQFSVFTFNILLKYLLQTSVNASRLKFQLLLAQPVGMINFRK